MTTADCIPDLETRKKNPYEYFPYFGIRYIGHEPEYMAAVERHALMFPERPRIRRNLAFKDFQRIPTDSYFKQGRFARYPVLVKGKNDPVDDPKVVPSLAIRKKNRLEYFPDFKNMSKEKFDSAVKEHAKMWPDRPEIVKTNIILDYFTGRSKERIIYKGDPYPVLIAFW